MQNKCKENGCSRVARRKKKSLCYFHEISSRGIMCEVEDCGMPSIRIKRPLCTKHYQREKLGLPLIKDCRKYGDSYLNSNGYILEYVPGHPQAFSDGRALQHRRVYSDSLGRKLHNFENIHHKNGNRTDNRLDNLELWIKKQPAGQRVEDLILWAEWILQEYKNDK